MKLLRLLTLLGDFKGEMAILFGACCMEEFKDVAVTPLSEIVTVFGGVPGGA